MLFGEANRIALFGVDIDARAINPSPASAKAPRGGRPPWDTYLIEKVFR